MSEGPTCKNCGKLPSQHRVRNEKLTCEDGSVWQWTDDAKAKMLIETIDRLEATLTARKSELFKLVHRGA
jgi:hypothetical protein